MPHHVDHRRLQARLQRLRLIHGPVVLRVVRSRRHEDRKHHQPLTDSRLERLQPLAVGANLPRTEPPWGRQAAVERTHRGPVRTWTKGQTAPGIGMDVICIGEGQREGLPPAHRHLLTDRGQRRGGRRVAAHQIDEVDEVGLA